MKIGYCGQHRPRLCDHAKVVVHGLSRSLNDPLNISGFDGLDVEFTVKLGIVLL